MLGYTILKIYIIYLMVTLYIYMIDVSIKEKRGSKLASILFAPYHFIRHLIDEATKFTDHRKTLLDIYLRSVRELDREISRLKMKKALAERRRANQDIEQPKKEPRKDTFRDKVVDILSEMIPTALFWHITLLDKELPKFIKQRFYPEAVEEERRYIQGRLIMMGLNEDYIDTSLI